jgi:hypothetical protein
MRPEHRALPQTEAPVPRAGARTTTDVYVIPVVVHAIAASSVTRISDTQIRSQIDVLNEDFSLTNRELPETPDAFKPLLGNAGIRFELASVDPQGNPTTGINRVDTDVATFSLLQGNFDDIYRSSKGGADAWDPTRYLNVWVSSLENSEPGRVLLGLASFPEQAGQYNDGVVCNYDRFGRVGKVVSPNDRGRTMTHEVGHYLGLFHIWGDETCGDDKVADTPVQQTSNEGCPNFPTLSGPPCANPPHGDLFMNYMDYTDDNCMYMFTNGQVARMRSVLENQRRTLLGAASRVVASSGTLPGFELWPNPATETTTLRTSRPWPAGSVVSLTSLTGQVVVRQVLPVATTECTLPLGPVPAGVYRCTVHTPEGGAGSVPVVVRF